MNPRLIDMFSGCGGLSIGFAAAGFEVVGGNDLDPHAMETYASNHPRSNAWHMPARQFVDNARDLIPSPETIDVLAGGPPCQGFCAINPKRAIDDPRNECVTVFLDAVRTLRPRIVVMENVPGLLSLAKGVALKTVLTTLRDAGYHTSYMVLQAAHYGSPQSRWRLFIIGSQSHGFSFPLPSHRADITPNVAGGRDRTFRIPKTDDLFTQLAPKVTVGDAISDLPVIRNGGGKPVIAYAKPARTEFQRAMRAGSDCLTNHQTIRLGPKYMERVKALPEQGMCWRDLPAELVPSNIRRSQEKWGRNSPTRFGRLRFDGFFTSILTKPEPYWGSFIHPTQNRVLSVREAARAQCFPDRVRFSGDLDDQYRQVGNAIPVLLARAVGQAVLAHLAGESRPNGTSDADTPSNNIRGAEESVEP